jgi:PAS domain S-box-containing protein
MSATNAELLAAIERLQSSEEELRTVNDELATVNSQLALKVDELSQANSDLSNLFSSTDLATLFVDREQRVARFTPAAKVLFRLIDGDVGRPIRHLASRFRDHDLAADLDEVLRTLQPIERQVETVDRDAWYLLRIVPYRAAQEVVAGAVVTLADVTQIKRAEAGLRRLATVVIDSNDAVTVLDLDGRILEWNRGAERAYGYSADEAKRMNVEALVPEEDRARVREQLAAARRGGDLEAGEVRRVARDGRIRDVSLTMTRLVDDSGRPVAVATTERDITGRKQRETERERLLGELQAADGELRADLDATAGVLRIGSLFLQDGNVASVLGEVVEAATAVSGADFGNIQLLDPASGDLRIAAQKGLPEWWVEFWDEAGKGQGAWGTALERRERVVVEDVERSPMFRGPQLEAQRRAGVRAVQSTPIVDRAGGPLGVLSTHTKTVGVPSARALRRLDLLARQASDILERGRAEAAVRASEERFRAIVEASSEALYRMSPDWSEMRQLHSRGFLANAEAASRTWLRDYIPADEQARVLAAIQAAIRAKAIFELEHRVLRADGTVGWTLSRAVPLRAASGEIVEWFGAPRLPRARTQPG